MKTNPVGWFEIYVQDTNRAKRFYEAVLQSKLEPRQVPTWKCGHSPCKTVDPVRREPLSRWMAFLREATARWSTSCAMTARSKKAA